MAEPNRKLRFTLKDILSIVASDAGGGHPHNFIDRKSATVRLELTPTGRPRVVIEWRSCHPQVDDRDCLECDDMGLH